MDDDARRRATGHSLDGTPRRANPAEKKKKHAHRSIHPDARDRDFQRVRATTNDAIDRSPIIDRYHRGYGFFS